MISPSSSSRAGDRAASADAGQPQKPGRRPAARSSAVPTATTVGPAGAARCCALQRRHGVAEQPGQHAHQPRPGAAAASSHGAPARQRPAPAVADDGQQRGQPRSPSARSATATATMPGGRCTTPTLPDRRAPRGPGVRNLLGHVVHRPAGPPQPTVSDWYGMPELRSKTSTHGRTMAGARALWRATGMTDDDFGKPIVAIANSFTQFVPGHVHLKDMGAPGRRRDRRGRRGRAGSSTPSPSTTASPWATAACSTRCPAAS